jgi:hypothetical protein
MGKNKTKVINILCAGILIAVCVTGCGVNKEVKENVGVQDNDSTQAAITGKITDEENHSDTVKEPEGDGTFYDGANLQGDVVEFSETGFSLSPATTETEADGGQVLAQAAPGSENDENNVQINYTDDTVFQIVNLSASSQSEVSREDTDKESVKKQSSVCVFGTCQDTYHWTANKVLILRWQ